MEMMAERSIIDMQLCGARALEAFVRNFGVEHCSIDMLLNHLRRIETISFRDWEFQGASLPLNGRGDTVPMDIGVNLSDKVREDFFSLVDSVVEIGIVDAYGGDSTLPLEFLKKSFGILESHNVPLPACCALYK